MDSTFWLGLLAGALLGGVVAELLDVSAWIAPRVIRRAAARITNIELRKRYEEEWLAELCAYDGLKLTKLAKAVGIWFSSQQVAIQVLDTPYVRLRDAINSILLTGVSLRKLRKDLALPHETRMQIAFIAAFLSAVNGGSLPDDFSLEKAGDHIDAPRVHTLPCRMVWRPLWAGTLASYGLILAATSDLPIKAKIKLYTQSIRLGYRFFRPSSKKTVKSDT